jgi:hypothetical protein
MIFFAQFLVATIMIPTTVWVALAVYYHVRRPWLRIIALIAPMIFVGGALTTLPLYPWALPVWFVWVGTATTWWFSLRPRMDRNWEIGMEILPQAEIQDERLHVRNFRSFSYSKSGDQIPHFEERVFDLTELQSIDYFLSHWAGPWMAHTLVSFGFSDGKFLCVSVEARRQRWQTYSPLRGLFRCYELMFVFGDERDIVRLRTNVRREQVYMYRLRMPPENVRRLLLDYVTRLGRLAEKPEWYNSIFSNCTTNLFYNRRAKVPACLRHKILLNGLSAHALYQLGFIENRLPFAELQSRCAVRERAIAAGDREDFSQKIREEFELCNSK